MRGEKGNYCSLQCMTSDVFLSYHHNVAIDSNDRAIKFLGVRPAQSLGYNCQKQFCFLTTK